jgi:hypothetical protein
MVAQRKHLSPITPFHPSILHHTTSSTDQLSYTISYTHSTMTHIKKSPKKEEQRHHHQARTSFPIIPPH